MNLTWSALALNKILAMIEFTQTDLPEPVQKWLKNSKEKMGR